MEYTAKKFRLWWIFLTCAMIIFIPFAIFVAIETAPLVADGYPIFDVLTGRLSAELNTSQGSSFNAIQKTIKLIGPLAATLFALSVFSFFLEKSKHLPVVNRI